MDECLIILTRKYLNLGAEMTDEQEFYGRGKILIEKVKLLCCLIGNNEKQYPKKKVIWNNKLSDVIKDIEEAKYEMQRRMSILQSDSSEFNQFQRNIKLNKEATKSVKKDIKENLRETITTRTAEFSSKLLVTNLKNEVQKEFIRIEMKWIDLHLKFLDRARCLKINRLYHERYRARKRHLDQIVKYDIYIGSLYAQKITLLDKKNAVDKEYVIIQGQLIAQRNLYKQLREEKEVNMKKAFLAKVKYFYRNRAAKIIQRNWKLYCMRMPWKKKKGKK